MTAAYDLWRGLMYCVGVFVTCNVGGMFLGVAVQRVSGLMEPRATTDSVKADSARKAHPFDDCSFDEMNSYSEEEPVHVDAEPVTTPRGGQSFEEMQRQIGATPKTE